MLRVAISTIFLMVSVVSVFYGRDILSQPEIGEYLASIQIYQFSELPAVTTYKDEPIVLGGFSGLELVGEDPVTKALHFRMITDRGPNMNLTQLRTGEKARPFASPGYQVKWAHFYLPAPAFTKEVQVAMFWNFTDLTDAHGIPLVGIPNSRVRDEIPIGLNGMVLRTNPNGIDPEAITHDEHGYTWIAEEYGPSLLEFQSDGQLIHRYVPEETAYRGPEVSPILPKAYSRRKMNRGFEGLAYFNGQVFAFMQSPLESLKTVSSKSRVMRILRFDTNKKQVTGEFLYLLDNPNVDKLGDAVAIGANRFLIVEQNPDYRDGPVHQLFEINLEMASNVAHSELDFESMSPSQITDLGVKLALKKRIMDLSFLGEGFSKIEGLAVISPHLVALAADNDFGMATTEVDNQEPDAKKSRLAILRLPQRLY